MEIKVNDVVFHPHSFADPSGRLFWWQSELYRAVNGERAQLYRSLFDSGVIDSLIAKGLLVETELTDLTLNNFELVLRHRIFPFVSYAYEWCAPMLKDAASTVITLELELSQFGLTLQDAHPWNVLFDGCKPIFVDFGSIVPAKHDTEWVAYDEFCRFYSYPLYLASNGYSRIARWLLHDHEQGVLRPEIQALTGKSSLNHQVKHMGRELAKRYLPQLARTELRRSYGFLKSIAAKPPSPPRLLSRPAFLQSVKEEIESINLPSVQTAWSGYYEDSFPLLTPSDEWTIKHHTVHQLLSSLQPGSVLDIGSNRGWYSQLASSLGSKVVAFDLDEVVSSQLYADMKATGLSVLPLVMDIRNPSPASGLCYEWLPAATERFRVDMVLALALVHHLVFWQHLSFDQIVRSLLAFSDQWLLVEFIPFDDKYVSQWWTEKYAWYTLDNFVAELKRYFPNVSLWQSHPKPRVLLLCER